MSAPVASPTRGVEELDAVRALQHVLYRAAKANPRRRFHALYDKVYRRDVLQRAWEQVRRNRGAPGIDEITITEVERYVLSDGGGGSPHPGSRASRPNRPDQAWFGAGLTDT